MDKLYRHFLSTDDEILSSEVLESAQKYQANDFPNLNRTGCPPNDDLLKTVNSDELPEAKLREHLLSCSPCYLEFQAARRERKVIPSANEAKIPIKNLSWFSFVLQPFPIAALVVLFCCITGAVFYSLFFYPSAEIVKQNDKAATNNLEEKTVASRNELPDTANSQVADKEITKMELTKNTNNSATNKKQKITNSISGFSSDKSKLSAKSTVYLDLSKAAVARNENSKETVYSLPSDSVTLNVKLPGNSPKGNYEISLLDEFSQSILKSTTKPSSGKNIIFNLDLRKRKGRARLCIALKGEIPDCFAVSIGNIP